MLTILLLYLVCVSALLLTVMCAWSLSLADAETRTARRQLAYLYVGVENAVSRSETRRLW